MLKFDNLSDVFLLKTGDKQSITIEGTDNVSLVYADAYGLDIFISVEINEPINGLIVKKLDNPKPRDVGNLLVHTLIAGDEERVSYKGHLNPATTRTAIYNSAKKLGIRVRIHESLGMLFVEKFEDNSLIESLLEQIELDETKHLSLSLHSSVARLRTSISNYARKEGIAFKTRVVGKELAVTRIQVKDRAGKVTGVSDFRNWVINSAWDTSLPVPAIEGVSQQHLIVTAKRLLGCSVSFRGGLFIKNSFAKGIEGGARTVRVRGVVVYSRFCDQFTQDDIDAINQILHFHGKTYEDVL